MDDAALAERAATDLARRVVRYGDLVPCRNAFIDTRTPGSEAKENFTIIGPGVSENPEQHVHIAEPHGFNIGGARQPPFCVNSQHSHDTAETFVVHSGRWRFTFGESGEDSAIEAGPGDIVSFPTQAFRGFANVGDDVGFLWSVLGGDDPGRVLWAPQVFAMARDYGLILLENGALVDTAKGQRAPDGVGPMPPTTPGQVAALDRVDQAAAETMIVRGADHARGRNVADGVVASRVIGKGGAFQWDHGFALDRLTLASGATWSPGALDVAHVLFVQQGAIVVTVDHADITIAAGDTMTVPRGTKRTVTAARDAVIVSVTGGDA